MSDLERDLTSVLAEQAGPSHTDPHAALAEHERRLAARARTVRNRAMAGVVAAVAVIGVSAVLVVNRPAEPSHQVATPPTSTTVIPETTPEVVDGVLLADFTADGKRWNAYVVITRLTEPRCVQITAVPANELLATTQYPDGQGCQDLTAHPGDPLLGQLSVLPGTDDVPGPLPDHTVWVTVPEVAEISVVGAGGDTFTAELLDTIDGVKVFVTSKSIANAQRYTFRDANGTVLREDVY